MGWQVLRNVSWRSWTITGVDVPDGADRDIVAFLKPPTTSTDELPDQLIATAATPALTRLPFTVPAGRELVVLEYQRRDACASPTPASPPPGATLPDSPRRLPMRTGASLSIATPLGERRVPATLLLNAPPSSASGCSATP